MLFSYFSLFLMMALESSLRLLIKVVLPLKPSVVRLFTAIFRNISIYDNIETNTPLSFLRYY